MPDASVDVTPGGLPVVAWWVEAGVTWMEWARSASEFATSRLDPASGEWSAPESIPCEPTHDGWRRARYEARRRALGR